MTYYSGSVTHLYALVHLVKSQLHTLTVLDLTDWLTAWLIGFSFFCLSAGSGEHTRLNSPPPHVPWACKLANPGMVLQTAKARRIQLCFLSEGDPGSRRRNVLFKASQREKDENKKEFEPRKHSGSSQKAGSKQMSWFLRGPAGVFHQNFGL